MNLPTLSDLVAVTSNGEDLLPALDRIFGFQHTLGGLTAKVKVGRSVSAGLHALSVRLAGTRCWQLPGRGEAPPMTLSNTAEERQAALAAAEAAYRAWADRHGVDADEATDAQLNELDQLQADVEERAAAALRAAHPPPEAASSTAASPVAAAPRGPRRRNDPVVAVDQLAGDLAGCRLRRRNATLCLQGAQSDVWRNYP